MKYFFVSVFLILPFASMTAQNTNLLSEITLRNINQLSVFAILEGHQAIKFVKWSPDGLRLAVVRGDKDAQFVEIWQVGTSIQPVRPETTITPVSVQKVRWLTDNQTIVTYGVRQDDTNTYFEVSKWNSVTGEPIDTLLHAEVKTPNYDLPTPPILDWNSDYSQSILAQDNHSVRFPNGTTYTENTSHRVIIHAEWSPNDHYLALLTGTPESYHIHIFDLQTSNEILDAFGEDYYVREMVWSSDSSTLAVASISPDMGSDAAFTSVRFYQVGQVVKYGNKPLIVGHIGYGSLYNLSAISFSPPPGLAWSPDNTIIGVSFPASLQFYKGATDTLLRSIDQTDVISLDWHPTGKAIATGGLDGIIRLWGISA